MVNPYNSLDWNNGVRSALTTHCHCKTQYALDRLLSESVDAIAISNYYKSEPAYTLAQKASIISDPDDPITDLSGVTGKVQIPNAEQHSCTDIKNIHFNSFGSIWSSGNEYGVTPVGVNNTVLWAIKKIKQNYLYADGGGVTINHPIWSGLPLQTVNKVLDYDDSVLGIEIYNQTCELMHLESPETVKTGWALNMWDEILKTGRRCWGFAVPDHDCEENSRSDRENKPWQGRIITITPEGTQEQIMQAVRKGAFYAQIGGESGFTSLAFSSIVVENRTVTVTTNQYATIKAIVDGKVAKEATSTTMFITPPYTSTYIRFEATTASDAIYSNPIMYRNQPQYTTTDFILMG